MEPGPTPIERRPLVKRAVMISLVISGGALFISIISTYTGAEFRAFFLVLLALPISHYLAAIYTYLLDDHSRLRASVPAIGRKAVS